MEHSINDIDDLLAKYFSKETSDEENAVVEKWVQENERNRKYFAQLKFIFNEAANVREIPHFDTDQAWSSLKQKLNRGKVVTMRPALTKLYWRVAAAILLIAVSGFFTYKLLESPVSTVELSAKTNIKSDTLPDGSEVALNKKTELVYSFDKKEKKHRARLKGEAFFKIKHEDKKDFVVDAGNVFIKDIGTAFDVKAYPESTTVEVNVQEGEVRLFTESSEGIVIHAGEKGIFNKVTKQFSADRLEQNVIAYKTKYFVYAAATLGQVVDEVNNVYEKHLIIGDHLRQCRLTVTFNDENIDEIATVIAETLGLTVSNSGNDILLEGNGCE